MYSKSKLSNILIKTITNPFFRFKPIDFKKSLLNAKNVLVYCPCSYTIISDKKIQHEFQNFFNQTRVEILDPNAPVQTDTQFSNLFFTFLNLDTNHLLNAMRSEKLRKLLKKQYDLYLDLSAQLKTLNIYIGYKVQAPLKIGANHQADNLFNLSYQIQSTPDKQERLLSTLQFLSNMTQSDY